MNKFANYTWINSHTLLTNEAPHNEYNQNLLLQKQLSLPVSKLLKYWGTWVQVEVQNHFIQSKAHCPMIQTNDQVCPTDNGRLQIEHSYWNTQDIQT